MNRDLLPKGEPFPLQYGVHIERALNETWGSNLGRIPLAGVRITLRLPLHFVASGFFGDAGSRFWIDSRFIPQITIPCQRRM